MRHFSLRDLFFVTALAAVSLGWWVSYAHHLRAIQQQRALTAAVEQQRKSDAAKYAKDLKAEVTRMRASDVARKYWQNRFMELNAKVGQKTAEAEQPE